MNSGLSSSRNHYGQRVITREADLVTAHEFGHNWGSEHDPDIPECSPSASQGGSYLMYTYSVSGYDVNNKVICFISFTNLYLKKKNHKMMYFIIILNINYRDFLHAVSDPYAKYFKLNPVDVFQNQKKAFVVICELKEMKNVMLVY